MPSNSETLAATHHQPVFTLDREFRYTGFNRAHFAIMKAAYGVEITLGTCLAIQDRGVRPRNGGST